MAVYGFRNFENAELRPPRQEQAHLTGRMFRNFRDFTASFPFGTRLCSCLGLHAGGEGMSTTSSREQAQERRALIVGPPT
jgi:hypothetical protein